MGAGKGKARRASAHGIDAWVKGDATGFDTRGYITHFEQNEVAVAKDPMMSSPREIVGLRELMDDHRLLGEFVELRIEAHEAPSGTKSYKGKLKVSGTGYLCIGEHVVEDCFEGLWGEHAAVAVHLSDAPEPQLAVLELDELSPVQF